MTQSKYWCFTLNNYSQEEYEQLCEHAEQALYGIIGREQGEQGTPHLQGYMVFNSRKRLSQVRQLNGRAHWERAKGSPQQNQTYCAKEGNSAEFGSLPGGQGSRNDLQAVLTDVKRGESIRTIREKHWGSWLRYHKAILQAHLDYNPKRNEKTVVNVYWGATGLGKTRRAFQEAGENAYFHNGGQWFDGYDGTSPVIFDDFGGSEFKLTYLLKLLDRYPFRVPIKGGFVNWNPNGIWITSNRSPNDWYPNAHQEHVDALRRRFSTIIHFENPFE